MPRSPGHVRFRGDAPGGSRLWFASAWLAGEIPARTPLTYREAKKSKNVRDEIEKGFDSKIRIFEVSLAGECMGRVRPVDLLRPLWASVPSEFVTVSSSFWVLPCLG